MTIEESYERLENFVSKEKFMGYDPYDTLLSWVPFRWLGKWGPVLAIQFQKRNPINIRPLLGVRKEVNPKAFGLFLQAYSIRHAKTGSKADLDQALYFYQWLRDNYSDGFSGKCWGYNFPWASPEKYMNAFVPSAVVTGFVAKGLFEYYKITKDEEVLKTLESACLFLDKDLAKFEDGSGLSISYTPLKPDVCYNASLLAAEALAKTGSLTNNVAYQTTAKKSVEFVLRRQQTDGRWNYSWDEHSGKERTQIDFHQGYVLESIYEIKKALKIEDPSWEKAIARGASFYHSQQFDTGGRSFWRLPRKYPVEIHNQSQGVITFKLLKDYDPAYANFATSIANWTSANMQANDGHFHYQKFKTHTHGIAYMRWSQAWMFLAMTKLLYGRDEG